MGHLKEINQSWSEHFVQAWKYIYITIKILFKLIIHSFFPNIFQNTGYNEIIKKPKQIRTPKKIEPVVEIIPEPTPEVKEKRVLVYTSRNS